MRCSLYPQFYNCFLPKLFACGPVVIPSLVQVYNFVSGVHRQLLGLSQVEKLESDRVCGQVSFIQVASSNRFN